MKENKILRMIILVLVLFLFNSTVKAGYLYEYGFTNNGEKIITCEYNNKTIKQDFILEAQVDSNGNSLNLFTYVNGPLKQNQIVKSDKKIPSEALREDDLTNYINYKGKCPEYVGYYKGIGYTNGYVFSDEEEIFEGAKFSLELKKVYTSEDYCHYTFNSEKEWGMFVRKDKKNFENGYNGENCPTNIITELNVSLDEAYERKYFASDEGVSLEVTKMLCEKTAGEEVDARDRTDVKCYIGSKDNFDKTIDDGHDENDKKNKQELDCNGLFDYETKQFINTAYFVLEIIAILVVVGLTIKDYMVAILSSNQDEIKKSNKRLLTRLIILVVILLLPALLNLIIKLFKIEMFSSDPLCGTIKK